MGRYITLYKCIQNLLQVAIDIFIFKALNFARFLWCSIVITTEKLGRTKITVWYQNCESGNCLNILVCIVSWILLEFVFYAHLIQYWVSVKNQSNANHLEDPLNWFTELFNISTDHINFNFISDSYKTTHGFQKG